jgi:hypothetical protein
VTDKDPAKYLPIGVQKIYFLLPKADREILNTALELITLVNPIPSE